MISGLFPPNESITTHTHTQAHRRTLNVTFVGSKSVRGEYLGG